MVALSYATGDGALRAALAGKRVVVTRPGMQGEALATRLQELGATAVHIEVVVIVPPENPGALSDTLCRLDEYDWIAFASASGVRAVGAHDAARQLLARHEGPRVAAVGVATARSAEALGWRVEVIPSNASGASLGHELPIHAAENVLLPRAEGGLPALAAALRARGAKVTEVIAYRTIGNPNVGPAFSSLQTNRADAITFTSPSTVTQFMIAAAHAGYNPVRAQQHEGLDVVCIGETTAASARSSGLAVSEVARTQSEQGLIEALSTCFTKRSVNVAVPFEPQE